MDRETLEKYFPALAKETEETNPVSIQSIRTSIKEGKKAVRNLQGYSPTIIDFIRRCETPKQAEEIIDFMEEQGKITKKYARELRIQLVENGIRSFGKKKEPGYYERQRR